jgi:hypothetical protein
MRRVWITLLAAAVALVIALPAGAGKPDFCDGVRFPDGHPRCPTTTVPTTTTTEPSEEVADCVFTSEGVLLYPDGEIVALGQDSSNHRCKLTADAKDSFTFEIGTLNGATVVQHSQVAVNDVYPSWGNICFRDYVRRVRNPDSDREYVFATFETGGALDTYTAGESGEPDGRCGVSEDTDGANSYALTFQTGTAKGGTAQLTMIDADGNAPMQD